MLRRSFCINSRILKAVHAKKTLNVLGERMDGKKTIFPHNFVARR